MSAKPASKPRTFADCLANATPTQRAAIERICKAITAAVPDAEESVSYGLAAYRLNGKPLVALAAWKNHCALYPMSGRVFAELAAELEKFDTDKGTIRFPAEKPLPAALVKKLVKLRAVEIAAKGAKRGKPAAKEPQTDPAVVQFLAELDHPLKKDIETVRKIILGASPTIREGVKWSAPSFRTSDFFATVNLRSKDAVQLVFHTGAKVKSFAKTGLDVADPTGLLQWLAKDRALVTLGAGKDIKTRRAAFEQLVRNWIQHL